MHLRPTAGFLLNAALPPGGALAAADEGFAGYVLAAVCLLLSAGVLGLWLRLRAEARRHRATREELRRREEGLRSPDEEAAARRRAEAENRAILDALPDTLLRLDRTGNLLAARGGPGAEGGNGSAAGDARSVQDLVPGEPGRRLWEQARRALDTGAPQLFEYTLPGPDGPRHHEARCAASGRDEVLILVRDLTGHREAVAHLEQSLRQVRALSARLQSVREEERARIAREVHDELGMALTGLRLDLAWLHGRLSELAAADPSRRPLLDKVNGLVKAADEAIRSGRRICTELRPGVLDAFGLTAALEWHARDFQERTGIRCALDTEREVAGLDRDTATAVYRIFQEALTNVARHAEATGVRVRLQETPGWLVLEVADDGRGITEEQVYRSKSFGLLGMRERALLIGGELSVQGAPGKGTTLTLLVPLPDADGKKAHADSELT